MEEYRPTIPAKRLVVRIKRPQADDGGRPTEEASAAGGRSGRKRKPTQAAAYLATLKDKLAADADADADADVVFCPDTKVPQDSTMGEELVPEELSALLARVQAVARACCKRVRAARGESDIQPPDSATKPPSKRRRVRRPVKAQLEVVGGTDGPRVQLQLQLVDRRKPTAVEAVMERLIQRVERDAGRGASKQARRDSAHAEVHRRPVVHRQPAGPVRLALHTKGTLVSARLSVQKKSFDELPQGWTCTEHITSGGHPYKRYYGPEGQKAQSMLDAWRQEGGARTVPETCRRRAGDVPPKEQWHCPVEGCGKVFASYNGLWTHKKAHHPTLLSRPPGRPRLDPGGKEKAAIASVVDRLVHRVEQNAAAEEPKQPRGPRPVTPKMPTAPKSAYLCFQQERRRELLEAPPPDLGDISRHVGRQWKSMSADERRKWQEASEKDLERYQGECAAAAVLPNVRRQQAGPVRLALRTSSTGVSARLSVSCPFTSKIVDCPRRLPSGWTCIEHVSISGNRYRRYAGPEGQHAESVPGAWRAAGSSGCMPAPKQQPQQRRQQQQQQDAERVDLHPKVHASLGVSESGAVGLELYFRFESIAHMALAGQPSSCVVGGKRGRGGRGGGTGQPRGRPRLHPPRTEVEEVVERLMQRVEKAAKREAGQKEKQEKNAVKRVMERMLQQVEQQAAKDRQASKRAKKATGLHDQLQKQNAAAAAELVRKDLEAEQAKDHQARADRRMVREQQRSQAAAVLLPEEKDTGEPDHCDCGPSGCLKRHCECWFAGRTCPNCKPRLLQEGAAYESAEAVRTLRSEQRAIREAADANKSEARPSHQKKSDDDQQKAAAMALAEYLLRHGGDSSMLVGWSIGREPSVRGTNASRYFSPEGRRFSSRPAVADHLLGGAAWVQCDDCKQWRELRHGARLTEGDSWACVCNPDPRYNRCEVPEDPKASEGAENDAAVEEDEDEEDEEDEDDEEEEEEVVVVVDEDENEVVVVEDDDVWEVHELLARRVSRGPRLDGAERGAVQYLVRWSGWAEQFDSWEADQNIADDLKERFARKATAPSEPRGQGRRKRAAPAAPSIGSSVRQKRRRRNEEPPDEAPSPEAEEEVEVEGEELEMDEVRVKVEGERAKEVAVSAVDEVVVEAAREQEPDSEEGRCGWGVEDPEALIGQRVRVWWEGNGRWYSGVIHRYNATTGQHQVLYDDADKRWYVLGTGATTGGDGGDAPCWQLEQRVSTDVQENVDEWHELPLRCALSHAPLTEPSRGSGCAHLSRCNYAPLRAHVARHHTCPCVGCGATMPRTRDVLRDETLAAQLSKLPSGTESAWVRGGEVRIEPRLVAGASVAETIVID